MVNEEVILSVFFCGTDGQIDPPTTQIGTFAALTNAQDLTDQQTDINVDETQFKMGFDGCGTVYGLRGMLFAHGLEQQCDVAVARVNELLTMGKKVKLNLLGLSRGGIAELFLIQKLKHIDCAHLEINALIFDPVPGNLITARKLDFLRQTTANKAIDVSDSKNLNDVLAIYPVEPLPDFAFHAPLMPQYPNHTSVKNMVIPGCHQSALMNYPENQPIKFTDTVALGSRISHYTIYHFLQNHGTQLAASPMLLDQETILECMQRFTPEQSNRAIHHRNGKPGLSIQSIPSSSPYMSREHYRLQNHLAEDAVEEAGVVFNLRFKPDLPWQPKQDIQTPEKETLLNFATTLKESISTRSHKKSESLQSIIDYIHQHDAISLEQANYILRDILALSLQRERHPSPLWTYSRTGLNALSLLKKPEFTRIKLLVQPTEKQTQYKDLREFIIGANTSRYFVSKHRDRNYTTLNISTRYRNQEDAVSDSYGSLRAIGA